MLQRYFFAGCAPLPTNGYSLLHHYHFLGSFVSKNNFEHKMFVLQHFFACIFCRVRTCNGCWSTSRKNTRKLSRLVLQIAPSNGGDCTEQLGGLPRAISCHERKLILPTVLPFIPHRSHGRTGWCSLGNGQSAVRSLSVDSPPSVWPEVPATNAPPTLRSANPPKKKICCCCCFLFQKR